MSLDLGVIFVWGSALLSGAWIAIAVASAATGRMIVNPRRIPWSSREVEILSVVMVIQGLAFAIYSLVGGVFLARAVHALGPFVGGPLMLFLMVTFAVQAYVEHSHFERLKKGSATQETAR